MDIPSELRYSTDHEWARVEEGRVRIGITDYAQDALGDVVFVDVARGRAPRSSAAPAAARSSRPSRCPRSTPRSRGTVAEVNAELADNPQRLNDDPYGDGWIFVIEPTDEAQLAELLDAEGYRALIEG